MKPKKPVPRGTGARKRRSAARGRELGVSKAQAATPEVIDGSGMTASSGGQRGVTISGARFAGEDGPPANLPLKIESREDGSVIVGGVLVSAATGSTSLPLSDRAAAWDAPAAAKSLDPAQYPKAFFWIDPEGDPETLAAYKLGFASADGGALTAIFRGVTACAGVMQGARGGVDIPQADEAGVKAKIAAYYAKARKEYDDPDIVVPWEAAAKAEQLGNDPAAAAVHALAYAESARFADVEMSPVGGDAWATIRGASGGRRPAAFARIRPTAEYLERAAYWAAELGAGELAPMDGQCANCNHPAEMHQGDMNDGACAAPGCDCAAFDDGTAAESSPREALAAMADELQHLAVCECSHPWGEHLGSDGPCRHEDGRGTCRCGGYSELRSAESGQADAMEPLEVAATFRLDRAPAEDARELVVQGLGKAVMGAIAPLRFTLADFALVAAPDPPAPPSEIPSGLAWTAKLVPEGKLTSDGRAIKPGGVGWRELPLSLMALLETGPGGHEGALLGGRIEQIWRDGMDVRGSGSFDDAAFGREVARQVEERNLRGISVDLGDMVAYEVPRSDYFDEEGNWAPKEPAEGEPADDAEPSLLDILFGGDGEEMILLVESATIGMATVCPFPAFEDASIELDASLVADGAARAAMVTVTSQAGFTVTPRPAALAASALVVDPDGGEVRTWPLPEPGEPLEVITASAAGLAPVAPPAEWFQDPGLDQLTPLTVDDDGRVYGHAWAWGTCHLGFPGQCVEAPRSRTGYAYYLLKEVLCDGGERVPCGTITLEAPHASLDYGRAAATAHYDNTGLAVADVAFGEDDFGGWFSGALRPDVDAEKARELMGATVSGDWRSVNGNRELVALLAVNVPGFPVPRPALAASGDEVTAMVAAGVVVPALERGPGWELGDEGLARLAELRARSVGPAPPPIPQDALEQLAGLRERALGQQGA